jgi:hypothetical protein
MGTYTHNTNTVEHYPHDHQLLSSKHVKSGSFEVMMSTLQGSLTQSSQSSCTPPSGHGGGMLPYAT